MPVYDYECAPCRLLKMDVIRRIDDRHRGPECPDCKRPMALVVAPVKGFVSAPAVPRKNP